MNQEWQLALFNSGNILLVENSNGRIKSTLKNVRSITCVAATEDQVIRALNSKDKFDTIMLDYDLTRIWCPVFRQNSLRAIKAYRGTLKVKRVIIHSWNPLGVRRLRKYFKINYPDIHVIVLKHWRMI